MAGDGSGYVISIEEVDDRPAWRTKITAAILGVWNALVSADTGLPPAGSGPEPYRRWRAVAMVGGRVVRVGDWRYERSAADADATAMTKDLANERPSRRKATDDL